MTLAIRIIAIVVGYIAANLAGWLMLVLGEWIKVNGFADVLLLGSANAMKQVALVVLRFGLQTAIGFALIPAAIVIAAAEWFRLRSILLYGVIGGIIGAWLQFRFTNSHLGHVPHFDWFAWRELGIRFGAGLVAGLVYWAIAGRSAGLLARQAYYERRHCNSRIGCYGRPMVRFWGDACGVAACGAQRAGAAQLQISDPGIARSLPQLPRRLQRAAITFEYVKYECSDWEQIEKSSQVVFNAGYASPVPTPRGRDILAACGQLNRATGSFRRANGWRCAMAMTD